MAGLDDDVAARSVYLDPTPIDNPVYAAALALAGIRLYHLQQRAIGGKVIEPWRKPGLCYAEHDCGRQVAEPVRQVVIHDDDWIPF